MSGHTIIQHKKHKDNKLRRKKSEYECQIRDMIRNPFGMRVFMQTDNNISS